MTAPSKTTLRLVYSRRKVPPRLAAWGITDTEYTDAWNELQRLKALWRERDEKLTKSEPTSRS